MYFFELLAFGVGICFWKKFRNSYWKLFVFYLGLICVNESLGLYLISIKRQSLNYNLFLFWGIPLQFLFFFWLFGRQAEQKQDKILPLISTLIYIIAWSIEILFLKGVKMWFFSFSYTLGNLLLVILLINYLLKFINSDKILNYKNNMMFWVAIGIAIFYLGTLPFFALRNTLYYQFRDVFYVYNYIQLILGCLMYLVFALSFIWGKPK